MPEQISRFGFGRNWRKFIERHLSEERVEIARLHMLDFLRLQDMKGLYFLDVGCGSGLHSLAAFRADAARIVSYDFDPEAVRTARKLKEYAGNPSCWEVVQGSILDDAFIGSIEPADIVYSWGVLHHTGEMWKAMDNCLHFMKGSSILYVALYDYEIQVNPPAEFWLDIKRRYNRSGWPGKRGLEIWYIWTFVLQSNLMNLSKLIARARKQKATRGMAFYTDIVDWLGGWPMEFAKRADVRQWAERNLLEMMAMKTGQANTEYLFCKRKA